MSDGHEEEEGRVDGFFVADDFQRICDEGTERVITVAKKWKFDGAVVFTFRLNPDAVIADQRYLCTTKGYNMTAHAMRFCANILLEDAERKDEEDAADDGN